MNENQEQQHISDDERKIQENIKNIKNRIAVFSGKGGVGKTTVSVNLAYGFGKNNFQTGILDADITGPNVAKMLDIKGEPVVLNEKIIPFEKHNLKIMSIASLIQPGQPVIWRGPMRSKIINQFLGEIEWGELDLLIADLPPGTGDEILTVAQGMKPDLAIIVTTPQQISLIDAERAINMAKKLEIPHIGIVENMSGFICPHCSAVLNIFGEGGGEKLAADYGIPFLGNIAIDLNTRILSDQGRPVMLDNPECETAKSFENIIENILQLFSQNAAAKNN